MLKHSWTIIWVRLAADGLGYWLCIGIKHPQVLQQETAQHVKHSLDPFQVCVCVYWACVIDEARHAGFDLELYFIARSPHSESGAFEIEIFIELINLLSPPTEIKQSIVDLPFLPHLPTCWDHL